MSIYKKLLVSLLIVVMSLVSIGCVGSSASAKNISVTINTTDQIASNMSQTFNLTWADAFFNKDSSIFQSKLAYASMAFSAAAYSEGEAFNVNSALKEAGFSGISSGNSYYADSKTGVGYTMGRKYMNNDSDVILAVILRGTSNSEWYGNFDVSKDITHSGNELVHYNFKEAETAVYNVLKKYCSENGFTPDHTKIWITGHSRGGAVANLLAAEVNESDLAKKENVFAYTFATPNVVKNPYKYENIFNIVNDGDFFSVVPLNSWGFQRYGIDVSIQELFNKAGMNDSDIDDCVTYFFEQLTDAVYDDYQYDITGIQDIIDYVTTTVKDIPNYYSLKKRFASEYVTMHQYFYTIVDALVGDDIKKNAAVRKLGKSVLGSDEYSQLSVMLFNMTMSKNIYFAHMPENYLAWTKIMSETDMEINGKFAPIIIKISGKETVRVGKKTTYDVITLGSDSRVKWSVSDKKKASISKKGVLKGKKKGTVKLTAQSGNLKKTFTVKIKK